MRYGAVYLNSALVLLSLGLVPAFAHYESDHEKHASREKLQQGIVAQHNLWKLLELAMSPAYASSDVSIAIEGAWRVIKSDGLPNHSTGEFPNAGNPNAISEQHYVFRVPSNPQLTGRTVALGRSPFGVAINGIPFDPGTAEWWNNDPSSGWHYEAMSLGEQLGLDENNAHVQPNGAYHYHGIPKGLLDRLSAAPKPILLGYAADGFPIYAPFGFADRMNPRSSMKELRSSYRVKRGSRNSGPGGSYDGIFTEDYEYVGGSGDLDDCNGRFGVTAEYPRGIYYYVITSTFPFISRGFKGSPDQSFRNRGGAPGGRPGFGPPGGRPGFGPPPGGPGFGGPPPGYGPPNDD